MTTEQKQDRGQAAQKALVLQKVNAATRKKIYESKIAALADRSMSPNLLKIMCQDAPVATELLHTPCGRRAFVKQCRRYYEGMLRAVERSERKGLFSFFS